VNTEYLLDAARAVDSAPECDFDMAYWSRKRKKKILGACGTTYCAIGWYVQTHPGRGLYLKEFGEGGHGVTAHPYNSYTGTKDYQAIADHFGITASEASGLFGPQPGNKAFIAKQIREFVSHEMEQAAAERAHDAVISEAQ
jgi:hypothetical protein